jgi:hypothetical protein
MSLAVASAMPDGSDLRASLDLGPSSHANVVNIQGLHLAHHHSHAKPTIAKMSAAPSSPARSSSEKGSPSVQASPTLAPTSDTASNGDDSTSVTSTEAEVDREMARAVVDGFTTRHVEVNVGGQKVTCLFETEDHSDRALAGRVGRLLRSFWILTDTPPSVCAPR